MDNCPMHWHRGAGDPVSLSLDLSLTEERDRLYKNQLSVVKYCQWVQQLSVKARRCVVRVAWDTVRQKHSQLATVPN